MARRGDFASFVAELLQHHYDPLYRKSRGAMLHEFASAGLLHRVAIRCSLTDRAALRREVIPRLLELARNGDPSSHTFPMASSCPF